MHLLTWFLSSGKNGKWWSINAFEIKSESFKLWSPLTYGNIFSSASLKAVFWLAESFEPIMISDILCGPIRKRSWVINLLYAAFSATFQVPSRQRVRHLFAGCPYWTKSDKWPVYWPISIGDMSRTVRVTMTFIKK